MQEQKKLVRELTAGGVAAKEKKQSSLQAPAARMSGQAAGKVLPKEDAKVHAALESGQDYVRLGGKAAWTEVVRRGKAAPKRQVVQAPVMKPLQPAAAALAPLLKQWNATAVRPVQRLKDGEACRSVRRIHPARSV